eukprot:GSA25T00000154001.1
MRAGLLMLAYQLNSAQTADLMELFFVMDSSGRGALQRPDFTRILRKLEPSISSREVDAIFDSLKGRQSAMAMARMSAESSRRTGIMAGKASTMCPEAEGGEGNIDVGDRSSSSRRCSKSTSIGGSAGAGGASTSCTISTSDTDGSRSSSVATQQSSSNSGS